MDYKDAVLTYVAENNITYTEFAKRAKISVPYLIQLINGKRNNPSKILLKKIELLVGTKVEK